MTRACGGCGSRELTVFLDLGMVPLADAYTRRPDEIAPRFPLRAGVCGKCRLAQVMDPVEDLFGERYSFYSSASAPLVAYHERYAADALRLYGDQAARGVVEVGCNDGDLLRRFAAAGCPAVGVDPCGGPVEAARARGLDVRRETFSLRVAQGLRDEVGPVGLVVANHVLAHVSDLGDVLDGVAHLLHPTGVALVEVQYLPDLLLGNAVDLIYHEHRHFFSLTSLQAVAERHGLSVVRAEVTDRQGGSLRVALSRTPVPDASVGRLLHSERYLYDDEPYAAMQPRAERIRERLRDLLAVEARVGRTVAGYGAPAKATTLLTWCGIDADDVRHVADTTPAKWGRYIPGTRIPIVAPGAFVPPDTWLLLAWTYAGDILRRERYHPGRWIVPLPAPVVM